MHPRLAKETALKERLDEAELTAEHLRQVKTRRGRHKHSYQGMLWGQGYVWTVENVLFSFVTGQF